MAHTGFVYDRRFLEHDTGNAALTLAPTTLLEPDHHIESPVRIRRTVHLLERAGLTPQLQHLPCPEAEVEDIAVFHRPDYITKMAEFTRQGGGFVTHSTPLSPASYDIARLAVGGGLEAVRAVVRGEVTNAYAMLRPPGHHALETQAMGFCLFNNIAIAAKIARQRWGIDRVAIVDWDVHHGNGTQAAFYDDPSVLFLSLHQADLFPRHSGLVEETGVGDGTGTTVNIPLPAGTGDAGYGYAFERVVLPVLEQFQPQLLLVSAGQDANKYDPLGRMCVSATGFRVMAQHVRDLADRVCNGRLVLFQEGGYSHVYLPFATLAILEAVSGISTGVEDPFRPAADALQPWQQQAVDTVVATHQPFWHLP